MLKVKMFNLKRTKHLFSVSIFSMFSLFGSNWSFYDNDDDDDDDICQMKSKNENKNESKKKFGIIMHISNYRLWWFWKW